MPEDARHNDTVIDPSPAHQAIEEVCAEYERTIAELRAENAGLRRKLEAS